MLKRQWDGPATREPGAGGSGRGSKVTCVFKLRMCISCQGQLDIKKQNKTAEQNQ